MKEKPTEPFFEGVEKLLEMWFKSSAPDNSSDLRNIPRDELDQLMKDAHCEIISKISNKLVDSYILSESSMFVSRSRFILKTCGTTTPLACVRQLLVSVRRHTGFNQLEDLFYSRKNFRQPCLQDDTYRSFNMEVEMLERMFPSGSAYCLGRMNRDCWYLFALDRPCELTAEHSITELSVIPLDAPSAHRRQPDQTLEILMGELDPAVMSIFCRDECQTAEQATQRSGVDQLIPGLRIDAALFDPCGYSMNGLLDNGCYATIHVTPEREFSYVSFETNIAQVCYEDVIARVMDCFKPGKTLITVFANKASEASRFTCRMKMPRVTPYLDHQRDLQYCSLRGYDLLYACFDRWPS